MKIVLVDNGEYTAVYHDFHKNKVAIYKTSDGMDGLMEALGVRITKSILCPNAKDGHLIDDDGFPYHLDNLPDSTTKKKPTRKKAAPKPSEKATEKKIERKKAEPKKAGRKARRPPKRKT